MNESTLNLAWIRWKRTLGRLLWFSFFFFCGISSGFFTFQSRDVPNSPCHRCFERYRKHNTHVCASKVARRKEVV